MRLVVVLLLTAGCSYESAGLARRGDSSAPGDPVVGDAAAGEGLSGDVTVGDALSGDSTSGDAASGDAATGDAHVGDTLQCPQPVTITGPDANTQVQSAVTLTGTCASELGNVAVYGDVANLQSFACTADTFSATVPLSAGDAFKRVWVEQDEGGSCPSVDSRRFERKFCSESAIEGSAYPAGDGTDGNPYVICTELQLLAYDNDSTARASHARLADDITLTGTGVSNLGPMGLTGTFDGRGHTISNLKHTFNGNLLGVFGSVSGGTVKNLVVSNATVSGFEISGAIVGQATNGAILSNLRVINSSISGTGNNIGGVVGVLSNASATGCSVSSTTVTGTNNVGGIAGRLNPAASISKSWSGADVMGSDASGAVRSAPRARARKARMRRSLPHTHSRL